MQTRLAEQYRQLWQSGSGPPDVFAFLSGHIEGDRTQQLEVLLIDQRQRWQGDQPLRVEDYIARLPELSGDRDCQFQLAMGEFEARRDDLQPPEIDEFTSRFPEIRHKLRKELSRFSSSKSVDERTRFQTTRFFSGAASIEDVEIGRYRLLRVLGEGAFGCVYLGFDSELRRPVAIKVPTPERFHSHEDADVYLAEARMAASLDHPNIVPVHDVGHTENGLIYVVSKLIEGCTLRDQIRTERPGYEDASQLVRTVAGALHHAHQRRIIHRDVKPGNILIEEVTGKPYVADFGLAIAEDDYLDYGEVAGTPAYMSPEQARGEGHRLDGRSDVFSLGVVFYELLTGRKPFRGSTFNEVLQQVISEDPRPPREIEASIPVELERICLKALSKRASDRYDTAAELAADVAQWKQRPEHADEELEVIPRGLRSFGADDADYFLDLIPGPRNRDGLPEKIQFWKTRIEEADPEQTFTVGLIYGPSGCGKTSLVKAGLLPRLSQSVIALYVEATLDDTESRVLRVLRKRLPGLPEDAGLVEAFTHIRRTPGPKVVLILDQFEQWLHAHADYQGTELVDALRQCDGGRLQSIVMVRDDFAMAAARFMESLDIPILQGQNFATVDLFDTTHASKVLTKFGQAFGRLPAALSRFTNEEHEFVAAAASGLVQEGKVVPVRLALFAEMVKGKPWVPATLADVGGTEGIGVNFLDETFGSRSANPRHRLHEQAARQVLDALLPDVGTDIKGYMRSHDELLKVSGYEHQPVYFNELLRILDGELRLITPTDPESHQSGSRSDSSARFYQLTHDYLVSSLREWLTRRQRETRRGRAAVMLDERTAMWRSSHEVRQLPTFLETTQILLLTDHARWNDDQSRMMTVARRKLLRRCMAITAGLVLLLITMGTIRSRLAESNRQRQANSRVQQLASAETSRVPALVAALQPDLEIVRPSLAEILRDDASSAGAKTRARLALLGAGKDVEVAAHADQLIDDCLKSDLDLFAVVRDALSQQRLVPKPRLMLLLEDPNAHAETRIRAATLLASSTAHPEPLAPFAEQLTNDLLVIEPTDRVAYAEGLGPVMPFIAPHLTRHFLRASSQPTRLAAVEILIDHVDSEALIELMLAANSVEFPVLFESVRRNSADLVTRLTSALASDEVGSLDERDAFTSRRNAAVALIRLDHGEVVWPLLESDRSPDLRSILVRDMLDFGVSPQALYETILNSASPRVRQALLLSLGRYSAMDFAPDIRARITQLCLEILGNDSHQPVRSAAAWLLDHWDLGNETVPQSASIGDFVLEDSSTTRGWSLTSQGHTLVHVRPDPEFLFGSPEDEPGREGKEAQHVRHLSYDFAVGVHEVTVEQFLRFRPQFAYAREVCPSPDCPVNNVSWLDAVCYCRWLSEQEGIPEDQMCYPEVDQISGELMLATDMLSRTGYRLLTETEWEYACRAGSRSRWFSGDLDELLPEYARCALNSDEHLWATGSLKPNPLGLFDICGNVAEWCHYGFPDDFGLVEDPERNAVGPIEGPISVTRQPFRGGSYTALPKRCRSAQRYFFDPEGTSLSFIGFRIARTLPNQDGPSNGSRTDTP